jgi:single-strand DNA-binding protein
MFARRACRAGLVNRTPPKEDQVNSIQLVGRLTRDPELRSTQAGKQVARMRLAVNRSRDREVADFFDVVAWEGLGEVCAEHLDKGRRVAVSGRVQYRQWRTDDGEPRHSYEVVAHDVEFLDAAKREPGGEPQPADDSDIPF